MKIGPLEISIGRKEISLDTLIRRLESVHQTLSGVDVTPETCMQSPTVHALVTTASRRISTLPVHVLRKVTSNNRTRKEQIPNHPVQKLLDKPNNWQSRNDYWLDATSTYLRYGNFYAWKSRGITGPIRSLLPLNAGSTDVVQDENWSVRYRATLPGESHKEFDPSLIHHVRGPARDFLKGDSPILDVKETIALEIAAEQFGASFFGNFGMPGLVFKFMSGFSGFRSDEERKKFVEQFQEIFAGKGRHKAFLLPNGLELDDQLNVDNEKTQFIELRQAMRSIIAGAFGVPPHLVGDLERATFSNIEEQNLDVMRALVLPIVRAFEAAMERDLLTPEDRNGGVIIRFNLDGMLRGDFKSRQEGLAIQRQNGVINANEWRDMENMNPREDEEGETYYAQGPSGQTGTPEEAPEGDEQ